MDSAVCLCTYLFGPIQNSQTGGQPYSDEINKSGLTLFDWNKQMLTPAKILSLKFLFDFYGRFQKGAVWNIDIGPPHGTKSGGMFLTKFKMKFRQEIP